MYAINAYAGLVRMLQRQRLIGWGIRVCIVRRTPDFGNIHIAFMLIGFICADGWASPMTMVVRPEWTEARYVEIRIGKFRVAVDSRPNKNPDPWNQLRLISHSTSVIRLQALEHGNQFFECSWRILCNGRRIFGTSL
jgi:hypothetical protein